MLNIILTMNILFVTCWYPHESNKNKGIFIKKHAQSIASTSHSIRVLSIHTIPDAHFFKRISDEETDENGIITYRILCYSRFHKALYYLYPVLSLLHVNFYLKKIPSSWKPDLVHGNVTYPAGFISNCIAKKYKVPYVITEHWSKLNQFVKQNIFAWFAKKTVKEAQQYSAVSHFLSNRIKTILPKSNISVIPNVISEVFTYKPKIKSLTTLNFAIVATWGKPKRPDLIVDALQHLCKKINQKIVLTIVGEGELLESLLQKKYDFEIERKGILNPTQLAQLLHTTDYFLHASDMETFSVVIAEALACGVPVCASNVGAISELITSSNGVLTNNSVEEWTDAIEKLISTTYNHELISLQTINKYSLQEVAKQFDAFYQALNIIK
jgi:glycosyltransferase involved in cell wall biosynthesis